ncbi:serine hydrolase domain-containing protein [Rhodopila sp.]|uniref:serine hydrolase domain-containing protein n=1 Tax=Rhodopila sp. TaxID=2480087 RepID=UPI003D0BC1E8
MSNNASEPHLIRGDGTTTGHLLASVDVPGIASAVIRDGQLERTICHGIRDVRSAFPVDEDTVFDAASLSKPVFAHAILQLSDQGVLSLDAPLANYLPGYMPGDQRASSITAKHVLSHTTGLPNWRNDDLPLKTYFAPGERFSYSGEGFLYLQKAAEALTGERLHSLTERLVLRPFAMNRSSFVWDWRFDQNRATAHDDFGRPAVAWKPGEGNAAATLQTTAVDYARFLLHVLDGSRLRPETSHLWLHPHIEVRHARPQSLGSEVEEVATGVAWGLGWGLEPNERTFFHWGNNGAFKAFTVGSMHSREALVFFMNGASGLALMPEMVSALMPGTRPSLTWLDYGRHDAPARRMLRSARTGGAAATWIQMKDAGLSPTDQLWIARGLIAAGLDEDGLWLRKRIKQAVSDGFP